MEFDIEIHVLTNAPDVETASEVYDKIYELLEDSGYEVEHGEIGPAIQPELLE